MQTALTPLVRSLLEKRGITAEADMAAFIAPDYDLHTHSPFLLRDMERAVERILAALERGERIAIYADFDADGIPGAAILLDLFRKLAYANVEVYIPHRDREGYGFHAPAVEVLAARGTALVITVDVGTTGFDAAARAKEAGVDVIVTDHHEPTERLPDAYAHINPKFPPYPFPHLCGAAVAYKLAQALLETGRKQGIERFNGVPKGWEKWLLDLVAVATVADMVPLVGENRVLAYWGLQVLRKSNRVGVVSLSDALRLRKAQLTEDDIGFSFAPRINAASRMDDPDAALRLLTTTDSNEADALARRLETLNASRKGVVSAISREAKKRANSRFTKDDAVAVLGDTEWKPSLLGLAANSLVEVRGGAVCLWGRDALGRIKGSCRSDGSLSVVELFRRTGDLYEAYGGHIHSGGFTLKEGAVHEFPERLGRAGNEIERQVIERRGTHDARLMLSEFSPTLMRDLSQLAPFGTGNPKPVFRIPDITVSSVRTFGKEKNHVEVMLMCKKSGREARGYDFFRSSADFTGLPERGETGVVLATLERDTYRGGLALRLIDINPAS